MECSDIGAISLRRPRMNESLIVAVLVVISINLSVGTQNVEKHRCVGCVEFFAPI